MHAVLDREDLLAAAALVAAYLLAVWFLLAS
jgi:hypothetical protein